MFDSPLGSGDAHNLALCALITVLMQLMGFFIAFTLGIDKITVCLPGSAP